MVCPRCGREGPAKTGRCAACGAALADGTIAAVTIATDTTGLPPGATFGPTLDPASSPSAALPPVAATGAANTRGATAVTGFEPVSAQKAAGPLAVGQAFSARYLVIKLLGAGGMGAVYQAWDAELSVAVALKVILVDRRHGSVSFELERRFKNELLLARQVTHKNVVRIHDLGEIDGIKYITMPYVQGDDLGTLLRREGRLPIARALRLARQIASGLEAAHDAGVVHRDLKPPNIMIGADELALILDFGISASTAEATTGGVIGTLEYMAPEQGAGRPVDARADIYAFGLILYEMLVGPRVAVAGTAQARIDAMKRRFEEGLPATRTVDGSIPQPLDALVLRCLESDPAARYQTTAELCAALAVLDENGELIPIPPRFGKRLIAASVVLVLSLVAGTWWLTRTPPPPKQHDPVSVVIADFQNGTGDPTFDGTLEPTLRMALEGAGFISAYDRAQIGKTGAKAPARLDEAAAREIAVKQGLGVVVSGALTRQGSGYSLVVKAAQAVTGTVITSAGARASGRNDVLNVATRLVTRVRQALGDDTSDSAQRFAKDSLTTTSLEVVHEYAAAMEAMSDSKFDEARRRYAKAVALDPNFGFAYAGLAMALWNRGQQQEAEKYAKQAVSHLDGMTERERYRTRGNFYLVTSDYQACVKEYGDLIKRYPADAAAHNNLALCSTQLRDIPTALEEMRRVVEILPRRALYRVNEATYAAYAGNVEPAEQEGRTALELGSSWGLQPIAFAQLLQGQLAQAADTYQAMGKRDDMGASYTASGLGDLAAYEGRFADAVRILEEGAALDLTSKEPDRAAAKLTALGYAQLLWGHKPAAIAAAERALSTSNIVKIRFVSARLLAEAGQLARARTLAAALASELQTEPQAYAKIITGDIALRSGDARQAIKLMSEAHALLDTWIGRFDLGRAYLEAGAFTQADSEFDRCVNRRGEAISLFLDEEPTFAYFPSVYYYRGRVREGLKSAGFAESYRTYLNIREKPGEDPLLRDVRNRAGH